GVLRQAAGAVPAYRRTLMVCGCRSSAARARGPARFQHADGLPDPRRTRAGPGLRADDRLRQRHGRCSLLQRYGGPLQHPGQPRLRRPRSAVPALAAAAVRRGRQDRMMPPAAALLLPAAARGRLLAGGLDARHAFSRGDAIDRAWMGWGALRVLSTQDWAPGAVGEAARIANMELVVLVL